MPRRVDIERRRLLFDDFFKVEEAYLSFERFDGAMSPRVRRLNFMRGDSVAALLHHTGRNSVVLISQFKYPAYANGDGWMTEVVAGMIEPDETPESAVRREILEETGYQAEAILPIATFYVSPGGSSERVMLYCADVSGDPPPGSAGIAAENEDIERVELSPDEAFRRLDAGAIIDAKTIIALMWLRARHVR